VPEEGGHVEGEERNLLKEEFEEDQDEVQGDLVDVDNVSLLADLDGLGGLTGLR